MPPRECRRLPVYVHRLSGPGGLVNRHQNLRVPQTVLARDQRLGVIDDAVSEMSDAAYREPAGPGADLW